MRKVLVLLIAAILIISGLIIYLFFNTASGEPWIEGGQIRHKLIAYFDDGTTGEISISNPVFSISYDDKNIVSIEYILEGLVDGESIKINVSEYSVYFQVYDPDGVFINNFSSICSNMIVDTVDGQYVVLMDEMIEINALVFNKFSDGDYFINVLPSGSIKYFFNNHWMSSNLPSGMDFSVNLLHEPSGDILIVLDSNIEFYD